MNIQSQFVPQFKVLLIGDLNVGKTTFVNRFITEQVQKKHIGNHPVQITSLRFQTNLGPVKLNVWDIAIQQQSEEIQQIQIYQQFYMQSHAALLMFDTTNRSSYKNIPYWHKEIVKVCQNIPMVLLGNKVDDGDRKVKPKSITFHRKKNLQYYDISGKSNYQIEKPFIWILRVLTGNANLSLMVQLPKKPKQLFIEQTVTQKLEQEWHLLSLPPLQDQDL